MVPDETAIAVPCDLYPAQDVVEDRNHRGASANGKAGEAPTKAQVSLAESAVVEADAKAKVAVAKARVAVAEASARLRVADAEALEAEAKVRVVEAQSATKVRVATAESLEVDLKIVKLRKELEVLTGESEGQGVVVCFCLAVRLSACPSLPVFLTRTLCCFRILCSPPFSFCFSHRFAA